MFSNDFRGLQYVSSVQRARLNGYFFESISIEIFLNIIFLKEYYFGNGF